MSLGHAPSWTSDSWEAEGREVAQRLTRWDDTTNFLTGVADNSGVLGPHDGPDAPWRFLHRQFGELLTAQELRAEGGDDAVLAKAKALADEEVPRWAEVLALSCELADAPIEMLKALGDVNQELALPVLPELEGTDCVQALGALRQGGWDGDYLSGLLKRWLEIGGPAAATADSWLWRQVTRELSLLELAFLYCALDRLASARSQAVDRKRFFEKYRWWPKGGPPTPELVTIPAGTFVMGSPEEEAERDDDERQHEVTLSASALAAAAVTNEESCASTRPRVRPASTASSRSTLVDPARSDALVRKSGNQGTVGLRRKQLESDRPPACSRAASFRNPIILTCIRWDLRYRDDGVRGVNVESRSVGSGTTSTARSTSSPSLSTSC